MAGAALAAQASPRTAALARSSLVTHCSRASSRSCERVFALLKNLFGEQQMLALADYVQASLMLNYNGRRVG